MVGALAITLHVAHSGSLKAKRKVVRSILDRVRAKFNVAAAETGSNDLWQKIELGFAFCGNEIGHVNRQMQQVGRFVESLGLAEVSDVREEVFNLKEMPWAPAERNGWEI